MKKQNTISLLLATGLTACFLLLFTSKATATLGAPYNSASMTDIIGLATDAGLVYMDKVEYEKNTYTAYGIMKNGLPAFVKISTDGKLISKQLTPEKIPSMSEAVAITEKSGCAPVYGIEMEDDHYLIKCINKDNNKSDIELNYYTRKLGNPWF